MKIKDLGEFEVIELLKAITAEESNVSSATSVTSRIIVDNGDDTAAWRTSQGT